MVYIYCLSLSPVRVFYEDFDVGGVFGSSSTFCTSSPIDFSKSSILDDISSTVVER